MPKGFLRTALALVAATVGGTATADDARLVTRKYTVGEFVFFNNRPTPTPPAAPAVTPPPAVAPVRAASFAAPVPTPPPVPVLAPEVRCNVESLARMLMATVKPYSWAEMGGAGRITFDEATGSLVVTQTADVHAHVADLLASMRRINVASMPMVMLELTVVEVPETPAERVGVDGEVQAGSGTSVPTPACPEDELCQLMKAIRPAGKANSPIVVISDAQIRGLMKCIRTDPRVSVLSRPQLVLTDMQTGFFEVGQAVPVTTEQVQTAQAGMTIRATPKVSADRRFLELRIDYQTSQPNLVAVKVGEGPEADVVTTPAFDVQEIRANLVIPAGKTVLLTGPIVTRKQVVVSQPPVLSRVPYVHRLFVSREVSPVKCRHLVLVKATVGTADELMAACQATCPAADCKGCPATCEKVAVAKPARPADAEAARLVAAYHKACADGRTEEALRLAVQALARDPSCFADEK